MACALTKGRAIGCREGNGGIEEFLVSNFENVTAFVEANGIITSITQAGSTNFYSYKLEKQNGMYAETHVGNLETMSSYNEGVLEFSSGDLSASESEEIALLNKARLFIIFKDNNGLYWAMGARRAADKLSGTAATGKSFGEMNGYTYVFTSMERDSIYQVAQAVIDTLVTA